MIINNIELDVEFDMYDLETAEKFENALDKINNFKEDKTLKLSEQIKVQCNLVFNFFNELLGEGTDKKIFGNKTNLKVCMETFGDFLNIIQSSANQITEIKNKYSPNRAIRRTK